MSLLQDIAPVNDQIMDSLASAKDRKWIELAPGMAWASVLWLGSESGTWSVLFRWKKGYTAAPHKHLSGSHTYILSGKLQVRDGVLESGDYIYEPNGMLHGETKALEDTEYLFISEGPVIFFDEESGLTNYLGWEEWSRLKAAETSAA